MVPAENLSGTFDARPDGWILHVVVGNGSPLPTFKGAKKPNRRFSHWWVSKDGRVEQYVPAWAISWAQSAGNPHYWSVETEGFPEEELTDAQLDALAALHVWLHAADAIAAAPGDPGIGTHQMGGASYGGHACPGQIRAAQRTEILRRARTLRTTTPQEDAMPTAREIADTLLDTPVPSGEKGSDGHPLTFRYLLMRDYQFDARAEAAVQELTRAVADLTSQVAQLRAARGQ